MEGPVCRRVPAYAPRDFWEALQMYWFVHLGTVTELNGWDAMNPGHLDQHLYPFYEKDLAENTLEVIDELHLLQPGSNVQISHKTPDRFLKTACRVIRKGYGYPSVFNADAVVMEQVRAGKTIEDAREGGCIARGKDYYDGGPRYNTNYIQCCGIGTVTDSFSAINKHVFEDRTITIDHLLQALADNFEGQEALRLRLRNKTPFFGNDDVCADAIMQRVYASLLEAIDGRPNTKGGVYHLNMFSTTCHVYFGKLLGASANGRFAGQPQTDGTSPSHGADRNGPTAVIKSLSKMAQIKSGGTLLNQRFLPGVLKTEDNLEKLVKLIRTYFRLSGHHIQFNVVDTRTLRRAQSQPEEYRDLLVRVAGYSDYFDDLDADHQQEIIDRTAHESF